MIVTFNTTAPLVNVNVFDPIYFSSGIKVWSFGAAGTAALAGLMGEMIYSPYDITGMTNYSQ